MGGINHISLADDGAGQFLSEEGVTSSPNLDALDGWFRYCVRRHILCSGEEIRNNDANLVITERREVEYLDGVFTLQVGEQGPQGRVGREFVVAACAYDDDGLTREATSKIAQQLIATIIRPL